MLLASTEGHGSHKRSAKAEGPAANVGEDARGDALGGAARLEFVNLVADQQVEEAPHRPVLHVVCQRVAGGAGPVGLPEGGAAAGAVALAAIQVLVGQWHAVLVHYLRGAAGAAGDPEGLPVSSSRTSLPLETAHRSMTAAFQR